ncbi:phosphoribosylglycinamide formyltransferase [Streptomyces sp. NPDC001935]
MTEENGETMLNIGVMTSGRGNALRMVLETCKGHGEVVAAVANLDCPALGVARDNGIPHVSLHRLEDYPSRAARDEAMAAELQKAGVDFVFSAGYSDVIDEALLSAFPDRVMSVYPSLLPAFAEDDEAIGPALDHGVKLIGVTFHLRQALSGAGGAIIAQEPIRVDVDDTIETVEPRILQTERNMLPGIFAAFAEDRVRRERRKLRILPAS